MHGFPTETREEAMMTLNFIKSIKRIHFPYVFVLRVFPNSDMEQLALENGISRKPSLNPRTGRFMNYLPPYPLIEIHCRVPGPIHQ